MFLILTICHVHSAVTQGEGRVSESGGECLCSGHDLKILIYCNASIDPDLHDCPLCLLCCCRFCQTLKQPLIYWHVCVSQLFPPADGSTGHLQPPGAPQPNPANVGHAGEDAPVQAPAHTGSPSHAPAAQVKTGREAYWDQKRGEVKVTSSSGRVFKMWNTRTDFQLNNLTLGAGSREDLEVILCEAQNVCSVKLYALCCRTQLQPMPVFPSASSWDWGILRRSSMTSDLSSCRAEVGTRVALSLIAWTTRPPYWCLTLCFVLRFCWWSLTGVGLSRSGWWEGLSH